MEVLEKQFSEEKARLEEEGRDAANRLQDKIQILQDNNNNLQNTNQQLQQQVHGPGQRTTTTFLTQIYSSNNRYMYVGPGNNSTTSRTAPHRCDTPADGVRENVFFYDYPQKNHYSAPHIDTRE